MGEQVYYIKQIVFLQDNQDAIKMVKNGKKSCTGKCIHIYIRYFFAQDRIESKKISITYCTREHMLTYLFTKSLQGSLFAKFHEVIMGWKHVNTIRMGPPSKKERVVNVVKVRSNQEEFESNMEIGGEGIKSSMEIEGDRTGYNLQTKENGTKKRLYSVETK